MKVKTPNIHRKMINIYKYVKGLIKFHFHVTFNIHVAFIRKQTVEY